jgi:3-oxoacyl-[acyl-carrier-protein] synthase-3
MRLNTIASYIPSGYIDNINQAIRFGETSDFVREKIGAVRLAKKAVAEETSDLAVAAVTNLIKKTKIELEDIDVLILITQNGDGHNLPHTSAIVHRKLGLPKKTAVFDVSLGCSGYVYGLQILKGFMQSTGLKNGMLVTADPYSKIINSEDRATTLLFGDASTATLLNDEGEWSLSLPIMGSDGTGADNIMVGNDGRLQMNGRQVFNFAALLIPAEIKKLLQQENLNEVDIDCYCLHQGSSGIIDAISRRFPKVKERFLNRLEYTGNTVSSSIPILLEEVTEISSNNKILISGFGVGLSWASMILKRKGFKNDYS